MLLRKDWLNIWIPFIIEDYKHLSFLFGFYMKNFFVMYLEIFGVFSINLVGGTV
jgi:hypothetical protein